MAERVRRILPLSVAQPFETWQVGAVRSPVWFLREGGDPHRAWVFLCLNLDSGKAVSSRPGPEEEVLSLLEDALAQAGRKWRSRPARVEVAEARWAQALEGILAPQGVTVEIRSEMPDLDRLLAALEAHMAPDDSRPGPLEGAGVTLEGLAAFARAAARFMAATGWRHLNENDLVRIEAPEVEAELRRFVLIHEGRDTAPELGFMPEAEAPPSVDDLPLGELDDEEENEDDPWERGMWTIELLKPWEAPAADVELWERHGLPWAGNGFIPVAGCWLEADYHRPDHRLLALFEGLFSALAAFGEEDLDAGRWETAVSTSGGPLHWVLSLPDLLEPSEEEPLASPLLSWRVLERSLGGMQKRLSGGDGSLLEVDEDGFLFLAEEAVPGEPETPDERAEALLDRAYAARGRRAVLLARQALEVWPDCADAYNLLAGRAPDPESAGRLFELGMAAGERAIGPEDFAADAGHFWGVLETRPYMRARQGLAESLVDRKRLAEGAEHFQEMLRLNPNDNQGVRHSLVNVLIDLGQDAGAWELLGRYPEDRLALLEYPRALLCFRREGDSPGARLILKRAVKTNRFIPGALLRIRDLPPPTGWLSLGREEEAALYCVLSRETWTGTAGALDWLRKRTAAPSRAGSRSKAKAKGKAKGKKKRR